MVLLFIVPVLHAQTHTHIHIQSSKKYKKAFGKKAQKKAPVTSQPVADEGSAKEGGQNVQYIKKITGDEREEQMEENLQWVCLTVYIDLRGGLFDGEYAISWRHVHLVEKISTGVPSSV